MPRPDSVHDVVALVRTCGVVDDARLGGFLRLLRDTGITFGHADDSTTPAPGAGRPLTPTAVLGLMVEEGLLTRYQAAELAAGRSAFRVGSYLLLELLGAGGMGQVFLAEHALLRKRVAVKVLSAGVRADASTRERFRREARAAAAINHPNVVRVFDVDAAHDPPFLVMEYVDGLSLQAAVARHGTFDAAEAAAVGAQIARGLAQAAAVGLVHRDIKPANLLVDRAGAVKILDLGIARFEGDPVSRKISTLVVVGTLDYAAPEQALDSSRVDTRADLYGLGATLYFLLAGHPPFPGDDIGRKLVQKQSADPPPIHTLRPDVPDGLSAVIARLLARRPDDRFPTPTEVAAALDPWAAAGPDFPARLFQPPRTGEPSGPATECGHDPDPTPPPPTRRILRSHTHRRPAACPQLAEALSAAADRAVATHASSETAVAPALTEPGRAVAVPDECGEATVNLLLVRRKTRFGKAWWVLLAVGVMLALAVWLATW